MEKQREREREREREYVCVVRVGVVVSVLLLSPFSHAPFFGITRFGHFSFLSFFCSFFGGVETEKVISSWFGSENSPGRDLVQFLES